MTAQRRLDRKARIAISVAVTLVLAGPVVAMRNCVSNVNAQNSVVAPVHAPDDGLLRLENGATVFLQDGALSRKVGAWLAVNTDAKPAFEIADTNFVPGSAELSREGWKRIAQIAQILEADPRLRLEIVYSHGPASDDPSGELGRLRASRLSAELIKQQVPPPKISSKIDSSVVSADPPDGSRLFVVLSR